MTATEASPAPTAAGAGGEQPVGHRTYEVYQRERVGESTALVQPRQLTSPAFLADPYPVLTVLREHYPCYRDWPGNAFWVTRYDDVTSVYADTANYAGRSKLWAYGLEGWGRDLRDELAVLTCRTARLDAHARPVAEAIVADAAAGSGGTTDLATEVAARYPIELWARVLDLPPAEVPAFAERYWRMQRGALWEPRATEAGKAAMGELAAYFAPLLATRRADPGDDLLSVMAALDLPGGPVSAQDVVVTLLEDDHETLHGSVANLLFLLLTHPDQLAMVREERRFVKPAYLEVLRHSPPVLAAKRHARHEVERFGRLLPEGALVVCSAAAANRDPRVFHDPERFLIGRPDLCQREPRGQYRADGLCSGISFGTGLPSKHPALPEDRPRSRYAVTRDLAVVLMNVVLDHLGELRLADGAAPVLRSLRLGEMRTCWSLPVMFRSA